MYSKSLRHWARLRLLELHTYTRTYWHIVHIGIVHPEHFQDLVNAYTLTWANESTGCISMYLDFQDVLSLIHFFSLKMPISMKFLVC